MDNLRQTQPKSVCEDVSQPRICTKSKAVPYPFSPELRKVLADGREAEEEEGDGDEERERGRALDIRM